MPTRPRKRRIKPKPVPLSSQWNPKGSQSVFKQFLRRNRSVTTPIITMPRERVGLSQCLGGGGNQSGSSGDSTFSHLRRWLFLITATSSSNITIIFSTMGMVVFFLVMGVAEGTSSECLQRQIHRWPDRGQGSIQSPSVLRVKRTSTGGSVGLTAPKDERPVRNKATQRDRPAQCHGWPFNGCSVHLEFSTSDGDRIRTTIFVDTTGRFDGAKFRVPVHSFAMSGTIIPSPSAGGGHHGGSFGGGHGGGHR